MSETITARPASGVECEGCRYQVGKGQRKPEKIAAAEYLCDNCQRPLCGDHIVYEERGDWWLCARCLAYYFAIARSRRSVA